jgi:hypothetical protein
MEQADTRGAGDRREQVDSAGVPYKILFLNHVISSKFLGFGRVTFLTLSPSFLRPKRIAGSEAIARALSGDDSTEEVTQQDRDRESQVHKTGKDILYIVEEEVANLLKLT